MSDISKINIGGGQYSIKDEYIRDNCIRTDISNHNKNILGIASISLVDDFPSADSNFAWSPVIFSLRQAQGKYLDMVEVDVKYDSGIGKFDTTIHNKLGDLTFKALSSASDITLNAAHYVDINATQFNLKEGTSFRINYPTGGDNTAAFFINDYLSKIEGDDGNTVYKGTVSTNNMSYVMNVTKTYPYTIIQAGPYIEINRTNIRSSGYNTFISGFQVISLEHAATRKEAKTKASLQLESGAVKLKYNSDSQLLIHQDLIKLISNDVLILQHTDNGDKTHNLCDVCRKTESLSSLSNYEYDESTENLTIKIIN